MTAEQNAPPARPAPGAGGGSGRDAAPAMPAPRGPLSHAVAQVLTGHPPAGPLPVRDAAPADPYGEDLQLALHLCFELHYRGFAGVDPDWEWDPDLLRLRGALEGTFLGALRSDVRSDTSGDPAADLHDLLEDLLVEPADGGGTAGHLHDHGQWWQLLEHAAHRSVYHLKEADPHAWVIPRLRGRAKTALVAVEHDEFGGGHPERLHAGLYADLLEDLGLDPSYGAYVDAAPAPMLATVNMMSVFGLRRSLRGALVGHFAAAEITTAPAARRMTRTLERLGAGPRARLFYTEHIEADAVHEQVLRHDVLGGLLADEPQLAADAAFGVRATELLEGRLGDHLLGAWRDTPPRTSLRRPLPGIPPQV